MNIFDPFGDYEEKGYLQNKRGLPFGAGLSKVERDCFLVNLPFATAYLHHQRSLQYGHLLKTHHILFGDLYPWAGKPRSKVFPGKIIFKGDTMFAASHNIEKAFHIAMQGDSPGKTLGHLCYTHPFLDGNGRAIFTFFDEYLKRKNLRLNWTGISRDDFLKAIDQQIAQPDSQALDDLLAPLLSDYAQDRNSNKGLENVNWTQRKKHDK